MLEVNDFDAVRISLASPEQIRSWSYGEVTKPETMNYRTLKPERDGLFCERIFGPIKDFECSCGKYRRIRYKGVICDKCGVEVARSKVRRERMGHIDLASPVAHIWFAKGIPSRLGLLLDMSPRNLERVLYFSHFVVTRVDGEARDARIAEMEADCTERVAAREAEVEAGILEMADATVEDANMIRRNFLEEKTKLEEDSEGLIQPLRDLTVKQLMNEILCQDLQDRFGDIFDAEMGADAILSLVREIDLDTLRNRLVEDNQQSSGQRRRKLSKQLRLVEALRRSSNKPDWMVLTVLPVLPPDLRPMIQLDGGRFATSDLNDLYRRVINRNNRLRHLLDMGAPEIIIRNEKRMLQEAVDSLIDNGRRGRAVSVSGNHQLKSLSDMLRGKHGRFRQNLLGKRVDYSGRSVIVVGPELELHQCGLPRRMALELFKPFVMNRLVAQGLAHNIKSARRLVEKARPEVYDILEEVVHHRPVLLNRAPTLHRLSIQAFEVVLIDGAAIQLHPLVCSAFNADFDGDQMAVHVPLSRAAVHEAREMMLSTRNMLLPSSGEPIVTPTLDMVLGCYYLTCLRPGTKGEGHIFGSYDDARLAYDLDEINLGAEIEVREPAGDGTRIKTSIGRIIFNAVLPPEIGFQNKVIDKSGLKSLVSQCWRTLTNEAAANVLDRIKELGFHYATISGTTIAASDIKVPATKPQLLAEAETRVKQITSQFQRGLITEDERYSGVVEAWMETTDRITEAISENFDRYGGVYIMANSGAKGNISQIRQMAGMRGLMTNPSGRIIDFPIKASLREGLGVLEYFISTHGARKGLADTALRTSSSGYLTRRLIDVAQDLIILDEDCGTTEGIWMAVPDEKDLLPPLAERINARLAAAEVLHPETGEVLLEVNQEIDDDKAAEVAAAGVTSVMVRSPLTCQSRHGVCRNCYGRDLARAAMVAMNTAVGIVAAQSIGEPGTQLTLRTFHTGGVVGIDITTGLPRVEELFEARPPRNEAIISEIDGEVTLSEDEAGARIKVASAEIITDEYPLPKGYKSLVKNGQWIENGELLAQPLKTKKAADKELVPVDNEQLIARVSGQVRLTGDGISLEYRDIEEREYPVPTLSYVRVHDGAQVHAGQQLTEGSINPQHILHIMGREAVQKYLVDEVQRVYRSQGVNINDKHIEVIARQMLTKVIIDASGDTELVPGEIVARYNYEDINAKVLAEGGEPATAHTVLLGITRASLNTDSWLAAASFQETTRVLADAAVLGKVDHLIRLKENVIIGRLIPARLQNMPVDEPEQLPDPQVTLLDSEYVEELDLSEETWALLTQSEEDEDAEGWPTADSEDDDEDDVFADIAETDGSADADADTEGDADDTEDTAGAEDTVDEPASDEDAGEPDAAAEDA
jgi:DNA-directed RNA polymerase subunit beta'